ncbi:MAG: sigma-70 family RNA polymerase sigma factor [Planctomycetes bacterium]|nr:sigma-70 family RNA polymerase sigma factor [Planctomycetota bacterium]
MPAPSDEELMLRVRDGDLGAFEQLVLRHQTEAWRVAYRFTGDTAEAEDLTQDAFLKILDAAPRYRPTAAFRTYLYRVLTRLCFDHRRKKRPALADPFPNGVDDAPSPSQQADRAERDALIQIALNSLPADYRMAVVLRYFEGLSGVQIADAMGRSVKAVERLLARAKSALEPQLRNFLES